MMWLSDQQKEELGQAAFTAYREAVGLVTYDGKPIPEWRELPEKQRTGWIEAAMVVRYWVRKQSILRAAGE